MLADNIREIFWVFHPDTYEMHFVNAAFERVTGRSPRELFRKPRWWRELIDPRDVDRVEEELRRHNAVGEPHSLEYRIVKPDGEIRWIWARGLPATHDGRTVVVGVAEDITQRKEAEFALQQSLSLFRATLDATADGILALGLDGRITAWNTRFLDLWRIPEFSAIEAGDGDRLAEIMSSQTEHPERFLEGLEAARANPRTDTFDVLELKDGRVFERYSRPQQIGDDLVGRVWSYRDTTARARAERELRTRTQRLDLQNSVLFDLAHQRIQSRGDLRAALRRITEVAADMLEARRTGVWLFRRDRTGIHAAEIFDRERRTHEQGEALELEAAPSYFAALNTERALAIHDVATDPRTVELAGTYCAHHGITSMLDAPVRAGGEIVGIVCFEHVGPPRQWTVEDESFAGSVADLVSIAMETAERHRTADRMRFLASSSGALADSLDYPLAMANVAHLAVRHLADWCTVDLVEDGTVHRIASEHGPAIPDEPLHQLEDDYPLDWTSPQPAAVALRTRTPQLYSELDSVADDEADDSSFRARLAELGIRSYMVVPLIAGDDLLGVISFASAGRAFGKDDLSLAEEVARRAATAIENARLFERAQEANRAKNNFLAVMSHELRTPLTAIMGYTELLLSGISGPLEEKQRAQLERIEASSRNLLQIIAEILAFARTETGGERPRNRRVELIELIRDVAELAKPIVEERGLGFDVEYPPEPATIVTDPDRVKHILMNLVSNAAKFTNEGSVTLAARLEDGHVTVDIRDTGIGIERRDQARIFEPFDQVEEATTREKGGTGLGLAVARRFARFLGGDITLRSAPGHGSTFTLELPAEPPTERPSTPG